MKKEIMKLLDTEVGYFRLNNISYLYWHRKDAFGDIVNTLKLEFDSINHVNFGGSSEILSRDYEGIISECQEITDKFLEEVASTLKSNFKAGYRNVTKTDV